MKFQNPQGKSLVPKMTQLENDSYAVSFVPDECGPYNISIKYGGEDVVGSPFLLKAHSIGEAKKCKIVDSALPIQEFGSKNHISVDATEAGYVTLENKILKKVL